MCVLVVAPLRNVRTHNGVRSLLSRKGVDLSIFSYFMPLHVSRVLAESDSFFLMQCFVFVGSGPVLWSWALLKKLEC